MSESVKGLKKLISILEKIPAEMDREVQDIVYVNALDIADEARQNAPVGTPESTGVKGYIGGTLRQSIAVGSPISDKKSKSYSIMANATGLAPYAAYVEYGTYKMKKQPFLFPAFFKGRAKFIEDLKQLLIDTFKKV